MRPRRNICRRKEGWLNCYLKLCKHICHARKVESPDRISRGNISILLFWFVMACVCLETRSLCLRRWMKQSRRLRRSSRHHKSPTTLIISNASDQNFLWRSLWRLSRRSRMMRPRRNICRRKEGWLNCYLKLCKHICHARKVESPDRISRGNISILLFWFVMACVCLETRSLCLRRWMKQSRRLRRSSRHHKSQIMRPIRLRRQNLLLRRRKMLSTGGPLRSKCKCNCYFICPRTLSIDTIILCINIIIIITTYELLNGTHSTHFYTCGTHLAQNPF